MNMLKTLLLLGFLTSLIVGLGYIVAGDTGLIVAFVLAIVMNIGSYWFSDKLALSMAGAQSVSRGEAPELYEVVENLARKANLPCPEVYIVSSSTPNAFATGRDPEHSAVAVTTGILDILNYEELEAVLAHELGHVKNRDILITTIGAVLASVITMASRFWFWGNMFGERREGGGNPLLALVTVILAPIAAMLVNLAISRTREFEADATGAELCGNPNALSSALAKLERGAELYPMQDADPAMANLYIIPPHIGGMLASLLSTHPPTQERIRRLSEMSKNISRTNSHIYR